MGDEPFIVLSRSSQLAIVQVEEALSQLRPLLPSAVFETTILTTPGDRDLSTPLSDTGVADDFFTRDIDQALLSGQAHLAIHSAKDLPEQLPDGLTLAAILPAREIRDVLVFRRDADGKVTPRTIGTSSPRRAATVKTHFPGATTLPLRGDIPSRLAQLDAGDFDAIIVAACALERLGLQDRIGPFLPGDPAPQQGRLAITVRSDARELLEACRQLDVRRRAGMVAFVGCPAHEALLSRRAEDYLRHADLVLHDRLLPDPILLRIHDKAVPVGKAGGDRSTRQTEIHRLMLQAAEQGKLVVRLKGGDPGIFGHLAEELAFLHDWNIRTDILPAVTAAQVASAHAHAPLTHRNGGKGICLLSGRPVPDKVTGPEDGNLALYMAAQQPGDASCLLREAGWPPEAPVVVGERVGYKDERFHDTRVDALAELSLESPSVFLVGVHAFPRDNVMLFTGTDPGHFLKYGPLLHWPMIRLVPRPLPERTEALRTQLDAADGIIFPGRFAVNAFAEALLQLGDVRLLAGKQLLAVGPATADELRRNGIRADLAAASLGGVRELGESLGQEHRGRYLYPCSDAAPQADRVARLAGHGIELCPSVFYTNRAMPLRELPRTPFQRVLFTSSSTVEVYFTNYPDEAHANRTWVAVGPSTLETLERNGLKAELLAPWAQRKG